MTSYISAPPMKTTKAYKLFEIRKSEPGNLFPLFIGRDKPTPFGQWIPAEHIPTKGFAARPGWHTGVLPMAPHLRTKLNVMAQNRVWAEVEIPDDVDWQKEADNSSTGDIRDKVPEGGHYRFKTSKMQGGAWMIGGAIRVNRILTDKDVAVILHDAGHGDEAPHERHVSLTEAQEKTLKAIIGKRRGEFDPDEPAT